MRSFLTTLALLGAASTCGAQHTGWGLWSGLSMRNVRPDSVLDYSAEYQVRLTEDLHELKSHFVEFSGFYKASPRLESNFGYRLTIRPDRLESRLFAGIFHRTWLLKPDPASGSRGLRLTQQAMYQRDLNARFNDTLLDSSTARYAVYVTKPLTRAWHALAIAGVMYTWNGEYTGLEKIRAAVGVRYVRRGGDRIQMLLMRERGNATDPASTANIVWLRYEAVF